MHVLWLQGRMRLTARVQVVQDDWLGFTLGGLLALLLLQLAPAPTCTSRVLRVPTCT